MRVVFFGTPLFAAEVLQFLIEAKVNIVAVISKPDKPAGRSLQLAPVPVKLIANTYQIPIYQPEKVSDTSFIPTLLSFNADLFVVVAYGEILRQHVLDIPKLACINLHASLLPKYRGAAPIQQAIIHGESQSGVTIIHMVKKMDAGDMIYQVATPLSQEMSFGELEKQLCEVGKKALLQVIHAYAKEVPKAISQNEAEVTFAPKIELEDCKIDFTKPAFAIHNLVRGVNPYPGAWCEIEIEKQKKRMKIFKTKIAETRSIPAGQIHIDSKNHLFIGTQDGALEILEVQLEGKKRMSAQDFTRGLPKEHSLSLKQ